MSCDKIVLENGAVAFVCGSRSKPSRCRWCWRTSTKLCDFERGHGHGKTCDAKMCDEHARVVGRNGDDTVDYCPNHKDLKPQLALGLEVEHG